MIKGIVGCKVKEGKDLEPVFLKLKSHAMQYEGFVGMERLAGGENDSVVALVSTWQSLAEWKSWAKSRITQEVLREAATLLMEEPRVTAYTMMPPAVK